MQDLTLVYCRSRPRSVRVALRLELLETGIFAAVAACRRHSQEIPGYESSIVAHALPRCVVISL